MIEVIPATKKEQAPALRDVLELAIGNSSLLNQPLLLWFLFRDGDDTIGLAYAYRISEIRMYLNVIFKPDSVQHPDRKPAAKAVIEYLQREVPSMVKVESNVPTEDTEKLKTFAQIGFKREGVSRSSIKVDGELVDQFHMGLVL